MFGRYAFAACMALGLVGACTGRAAQPQREAEQRVVELPDPDLSDALGQALMQLKKSAAPSWVREGAPLRGELRARERQSFLVVLKYGHCYRLLGVGGAGVSDLDLVLIDANGVEVQRDASQDPRAVIGTNASLCPSDAGAYRVDVRMREGAGPFVAALFRDPT